MRIATLFTAILLSALTSTIAQAAEFITVASTTSTQNSGLFGHILPLFTAKTGIEVRVVAVGTGQAIKVAKNGDADVLFVHHTPSELAFVAEGFGVKRYDVMMNDFILVGPDADPAHTKDVSTAAAAFQAIQQTQSPFVSRGDDSGTHKRELGLWKTANITPQTASGTWYREAGAGMGATLNMAQGMGAYALSDRGTWIAFKNKAGLKIAFQGDKGMANPYGVILVDTKRHAHVKAKAGQVFIDWLVSNEGQTAIAAYRVKGEQLFFPTANK